MLVVETVAKIRRAFFVQQKPIKQIFRELKVSRKVVRKVRRGSTWPRCSTSLPVRFAVGPCATTCGPS